MERKQHPCPPDTIFRQFQWLAFTSFFSSQMSAEKELVTTRKYKERVNLSFKRQFCFVVFFSNGTTIWVPWTVWFTMLLLTRQRTMFGRRERPLRRGLQIILKKITFQLGRVLWVSYGPTFAKQRPVTFGSKERMGACGPTSRLRWCAKSNPQKTSYVAITTFESWSCCCHCCDRSEGEVAALPYRKMISRALDATWNR